MGNKNKRKSSRSIPLYERSKLTLNQDYDLTQSFNRVRPYSKHNRKNTVVEGTYSDEGQAAYSHRGCMSSNSSHYGEETTGVPSWDRYDRLEDKFSSFSDKNEKDHTNLRKELEEKINRASDSIKGDVEELRKNKLSKQWYTWTIVGLVSIVGLIWILSYQEVAKTPAEIRRIENRINKLDAVFNKTPLQDDTIAYSKETDIKHTKQTLDSFNNKTKINGTK